MKKELAMLGIKRAGESNLSFRTIDQPIPPGTYSAARFASKWPEKYTALVRAGMPHAVNSLITIGEK